MGYEEKIRKMSIVHKSILERLSHKVNLKLPKTVNRKKLEDAYNKIENEYVWVLKKKE